MGSHRILVVDDDVRQCRRFCRFFGLNGFLTHGSHNAAQAQEEARAFRPDLVLTEICMRGIDGIEFCKRFHAETALADVPTILMTGTRVPAVLLAAAAKSLGMGPIHIKTADTANLLTRVREALRFPTTAVHHDTEKFVIDSISQKVWIKGQEVPRLPSRRFQLLCALLIGARPKSRQELLNKVWFGRDNVNVVDVTMLRLRQDLENFPNTHLHRSPAGYLLEID